VRRLSIVSAHEGSAPGRCRGLETPTAQDLTLGAGFSGSAPITSSEQDKAELSGRRKGERLLGSGQHCASRSIARAARLHVLALPPVLFDGLPLTAFQIRRVDLIFQIIDFSSTYAVLHKPNRALNQLPETSFQVHLECLGFRTSAAKTRSSGRCL